MFSRTRAEIIIGLGLDWFSPFFEVSKLECASSTGLEMPAMTLILGHVFTAFGHRSVHEMVKALIMFCSAGFGIWLFQTLSVRFSLTSEVS